MTTRNSVFEFEIVLEQTEPPIWRLIQIGTGATFWALHVAIQDAMGWNDSHLHGFTIRNPKTGRRVLFGFPDDDGGMTFRPGWKYRVQDFVKETGTSFQYEYDFGDSWIHRVVLRAIRPRIKQQVYPQCIDGGRRCPPDDVGGARGFREFLEAMANPRHKEHASMLEWYGGPFDPDDFLPSMVRFSSPVSRLSRALRDELDGW